MNEYIDTMKRRVKRHYKSYKIFVRPCIEALWHRLSLNCIQNNTKNIQKNTILLFSTLRNEAVRIPYFLEYYRKLGVGHFIFVDNNSTDNFSNIVSDCNDVSVWHTKASYKASNFGMHWLNALLRLFGVGHWCVTVDPDEFLTYPFFESRSLVELTSWLESRNRSSIFCLLLDMYGSNSVRETRYSAGENPINVAPYFDGNGYVQTFGTARGEIYTQGGPRRRIFFRDNPTKAPAINKTPLIKWKKGYNYLSSMHTHSHMRINHPHGRDGLSPTGCLLHFKFLSILAEKAEEEIERKEHYDSSKEYIAYAAVLKSDEDNLVYEHSIKFEGSQQLIELGFMQRGSWF